MAYQGKTLAQMTPAERAVRVKQLLAAGNSKAIGDKFAPAELLAKRSSTSALADPGRRSKLPDSALTADLLKRRMANAQAKDPSFIQAGADADVKYGDAINNITRTQSQVPSWFDAYKAEIDQANKAVSDANAQAQTEVANRTAASGTAATAANQQAISQAQADAALRGAIVDPKLAQQGANAVAATRGGADAFGNLLSSQTAADVSHGANRKVAAGAGEVSAKTLLAQKLTDAQKERGAFKLSDFQQLLSDKSKAEQDAQTNAFNQKIAAAGLGIKQSQLGLDAKKTDAQIKAASRPKPSEEKTQLEVDYFKKHGVWPSTASKSGGSSATDKKTAQTNMKSVLQVKQAFSVGLPATVNSYGITTTPAASGFAAVKKRLQQQGTDPRVISVAESLYRNKGSLGPDGVKNAKSLGLDMKQFKVVK